MTASRAVVITGCSSGIGKATARRRRAAGWTVYATARKRGDLAELEAAGCHTLALDVTQPASMTEAVHTIEAAHGAVGVLINNAGYSQSGAFEAVPIDRIRAQLETNVLGPIQLTQLVLPKMRAQRWGKIGDEPAETRVHDHRGRRPPRIRLVEEGQVDLAGRADSGGSSSRAAPTSVQPA